jgi:hypothetical protein
MVQPTSITAEFHYKILILLPNVFTILFKDINSGYPTEYQNTAGDSSRYFYASSYADLSSIESSVLAAISGCPVPTTTTTTTTDKSVTTTVDASLENADVCKSVVTFSIS